MMRHTKAAVAALLEADPSVTQEQAKAALDALAGRTASGLLPVRGTGV